MTNLNCLQCGVIYQIDQTDLAFPALVRRVRANRNEAKTLFTFHVQGHFHVLSGIISHWCLEYTGVSNLHCLPGNKVFIEVDTEVCLGRTVKGCGLKAPDLAECENSSPFKPVVLV